MDGKFNDFSAKQCLLNASLVLTTHQMYLQTSSRTSTRNAKSRSPTIPALDISNSKIPAATIQ